MYWMEDLIFYKIHPSDVQRVPSLTLKISFVGAVTLVRHFWSQRNPSKKVLSSAQHWQQTLQTLAETLTYMRCVTKQLTFFNTYINEVSQSHLHVGDIKLVLKLLVPSSTIFIEACLVK